MKEFHHIGIGGHRYLSGETMTVKELKEKLAEYPDDMPVFGTWEGVCGYIKPEDFVIEEIHKGDEAEKCQCLLLDVERY